MKKWSIPIARTHLLDEEINSVLEPLKSGWLVQGPKVREFEERWSDFTNSIHSIAVTSCTSGLHLSLVALGFGSGDEAIVPAFTWISSANVIEHLGGTPVFCDVGLSDFNIEISEIEKKITSRTKAIVVVHLFGMAAEMSAIHSLAKKHKLLVVEDAACGFGSYYNGKHVGNFGETGVFSFHPRKAITTGEGGMITTQNKHLAEKLRRLRDHGADISDLKRHQSPKPFILADHPDAGYNQRMTDIQGALGSSQMTRAQAIIDERRDLAARYDHAFIDIDWLQTPKVPDGHLHGYQSYPCLFQPELCEKGKIREANRLRNKWMDWLQQSGISTRPATHAVHMLSYYRDKYSLKPSDFPKASVANDCSISLPLFNGMSREEQNYVIEQVQKAVF
jgi:dTDP-4-amino-4,6-dideoxygalactose transaminase